jgi:hypothetical protein
LTPVTSTGGDGIPVGQLQAALDHYSDGAIVLIGPDYATPYAADGVHKPALSYRTQGGVEGKVLAQVAFSRIPWRPFYPRAVTLSGKRIQVRFWVPYPPLIFDETSIAPLPDGNKGFEVTDSSSADTKIVSVALTSGQTDSVDITLSAPPSGAVELRYAWTAGGLGAAFAGPANGPRGNVADSDNRVSWAGDSLRDYALTFRIPGITPGSPYRWEPSDPDLSRIAAPAATFTADPRANRAVCGAIPDPHRPRK